MHESVKRVHFVGIGGIGMSGIAEILISYGYSVSGSDLKKSALTDKLKSKGAKIYFGHEKENIDDAQVVVYSSAVKKDNPEVAEALRKKLPVIQRGQMLSEILRKGFAIAVSGAHGKTTTTAMISRAIRTQGIHPTVIIGGIIRGVSKNAILGKGKFFVAEADESDGSFQKIRANIAVVTNMDREHMDYYGDFGAMEKAYLYFMNGVPFDGLVTLCGDDERLKNLIPGIERRHMTYGLGGNNDLRAENIELKGFKTSFDVRLKDKKLGKISMPTPGMHNVLNALAAVSVGLEVGLFFKNIAANLKEFEGIERRMEVKGEIGGVTVVDDYAHHPTEILSTLQAARRIWDGRRFVVLFQPHRFSRVMDLMDLFPEAFGDADLVFVTDIYSAGEKPIENINSDHLAELIKRNGKETLRIGSWKEDIEKIRAAIKPGDVVFSLGAGDITKFYDNFSQISSA